MALNQSFWHKKRVLVTGHTGFKGSWLCLWLNELGAQVTGIALPPPSEPSLFSSVNLSKKIDSHITDICDLANLKRIVEQAQPEIIFHMAAQSLVLQSYKDPVESYMTNVIGTANVFEALRGCDSVKAIVNITTDKCYENKEWHWGYRESDPLGGHDPYSSSKACAELVTATYRKCFFEEAGKPLASVRAGNVIGGGDWAENRLVPDIVKGILKSEEILVRNPHAIRPWQHVLEPLAGYLTLAEKLSGSDGAQYAEGWNFGPYENDARPVEWITESLCKKWGESASWEIGDQSKTQPHEATYLKLDCNKARAQLGWKPRLDLDLALEWIVEWYKCYKSEGDLSNISLEQINRYQVLLGQSR